MYNGVCVLYYGSRVWDDPVSVAITLAILPSFSVAREFRTRVKLR